MKKILAFIKKSIGMDLPARDIPLKFVFPNISDQVKASFVIGGSYIHDMDKEESMPSSFFVTLQTQIRYLNRCDLNAQNRYSLTGDLIDNFYPKAIKQLTLQSKKGGVPEAEERRKMLVAIADIAHILMVSCQILFADYYQRGNYSYARSRPLVLENATRIFELLLLKQQARALRYQLLEPQDWQVANTLFYVLSVCEDVNQPRSTLKSEANTEAPKSFTHLFTSLHMAARFDPLRWPIQLQWIIHNYIKSLPEAVATHLAPAQTKLGRDSLLTYCYSPLPAGSKPGEHLAEKPIAMNCTVLFSSIRKDCLNLINAVKNKTPAQIPSRFIEFEESDRFVISEQLLLGLENAESKKYDENHVATEFEDLRIFVGFSAVYALLHHRQGEFSSEERLADKLARRSAGIAEDHKATQNSLWSLVFKSDTLMRLSTQESKYTTAMTIGSLFAYGVGDDINRPRLGMVERIYRTSGKDVLIDIKMIATYAEAVAITLQSSYAKEDSRQAALLIYNSNSPGNLGLIVKPLNVLFGSDQFLINRSSDDLPLSMENIRHATTDFYLFSTTLGASRLGMGQEPTYPDIPAAAIVPKLF